MVIFISQFFIEQKDTNYYHHAGVKFVVVCLKQTLYVFLNLETDLLSTTVLHYDAVLSHSLPL